MRPIARWTFAEGIGLGVLVIAAAAYYTPYVVAAVCLAISGPVCAPVAGLIVSSVATSVAAFWLRQLLLFEVDWLSYNHDNENNDLSAEWE